MQWNHLQGIIGTLFLNLCNKLNKNSYTFLMLALNYGKPKEKVCCQICKMSAIVANCVIDHFDASVTIGGELLAKLRGPCRVTLQKCPPLPSVM